MLKFFIKVFKCIMNLIYSIFKLKKTKNKVILLSRQSNKESLDFKLLKKGLIEEGFEVKVICRKLESGLIKKIIYMFNIIYMMYHLSEARYCIVDGYCIPVSVLNHKKELVIIQLWHALGAIKKFGCQILDKEEGQDGKIADMFSMHKNYTYIACSSKETKEIYSKSFKTSSDKIKIVGMPRVDYLKDLENKFNKSIYEEYPYLKRKKNIVYVPTFRKKQTIKYNELIDSVDKEKYNLIVKLHPLDMNKNNISNAYLIDEKYTSYDILAIADYIITDYSAIAIEASILNKPIYFYVYDAKKYIKRRGLNVNLFKEMKNSTFTNISEIIKLIESEKYDYNELKRFREKYIETMGFNNTKAIINLMKGKIEDENIKETTSKLM